MERWKRGHFHPLGHSIQSEYLFDNILTITQANLVVLLIFTSSLLIIFIAKGIKGLIK